MNPILELGPVIDLDEILTAQEMIKHVHVSSPVERYIVEMVRATRDHPDVYLGSSPRGSLGLYRAGQAKAALEGRKYVLPDDIKFLAPTILPHRVVISPAARLTDINATNTYNIVFNLTVKAAGAGCAASGGRSSSAEGAIRVARR